MLTAVLLLLSLQSVPELPWLKRKANFQGPAVVQLATPSSALVVHLAKASGRPSRACAPVIESILGNPDIIKAGCAIDQDFVELCDYWKGFEGRSRFDLGGIGGNPGSVTGLRTLCANILHLDLPKSRRLALSDWSQLALTDAQLAYCARDAWVGAAVAAELEALLPQTFSPIILQNRLQSQRSVQDLLDRQRTRRQAQKLLLALRTTFATSPKKKKKKNSKRESPDWKKGLVTQLKSVIRQNRYDGLEVYDTVDLGLMKLVNRTA